MWAYHLLVRTLRLAIRIFFRRIEVVGLEHVPGEGTPVIFCGNHPNSLLDPVLITVCCGRIAHFAAKDVLFQNRFLRVFLHAAGAVPIRRRSDHGGAALDNSSAFDRLFDVLAKGRSMGIFPEGISHDRSQITQLKSGAARIALGLEQRHPGAGVQIIPCGLNYVTRHRFRSSVLVQFGPPIALAPAEVAAFAEGAYEPVRAMTERIDLGMRALTVNASDWETLRVLDGVRRLYQPPRISLEHRVELARRFNESYPTVRDEPQIVALYQRVREYLSRLSAVGLTDRDLRRQMGTWDVFTRIGGYFALMGVWLPLAVVGALVYVPLGVALSWSGERFAPRTDVVATTKFMLGFLAVLAVHGAAAVALTAWLDAWAGAAALALLPLSGYATLRVIERGHAIARAASTFARLVALKREVEALRAERAALEEAVLGAVVRFMPEDMQPLFPARVGQREAT